LSGPPPARTRLDGAADEPAARSFLGLAGEQFEFLSSALSTSSIGLPYLALTSRCQLAMAVGHGRPFASDLACLA